MAPLVQAAGLYGDAFWDHPIWLRVSDLEALAELADGDRLELLTLLDAHAKDRNTPFQWLLNARWGSIPIDRTLRKAAMDLFKRAAATFFGRETRKD